MLQRTDFEFTIATAPSSPLQRLLALGIIIATLLAYMLIAPYASKPLARIDSFIPTLFAMVFVSDLITAVLLFAQFAATGSRPLVVLASGYLFSSLIVVGHVLTFPGAFTPTGLLGAGAQSAAWLNVLWRFGLAASLALYAAQGPGAQTENAVASARRSAILWSVAIVTVGVCTLIYAVTAGHEFLPPVLLNGRQLPLARYVGGVVIVMDLLALFLMVRTGGRSILDLWLIVVAFALLAESIMKILEMERYTLGFYAIRLIALPVSKVVLVVLLWETMRLYANLAISNKELKSERANRLTNAAAMTAAIAHEVRQPIMGIKLLSAAGRRSLARTSPDVSTADSLLGEINAAAIRANEVFDGFLKLFGGGVLAAQRVDLNDVAQEAIGLLQEDMDSHGVTACVELEPDLPIIQGRTGQLREVILNLIQNSIDAMAKTTNRPRVINIKTSRRGSAILFTLRDTGPGIDPGKMESIFDPFVTTKSNGTGLGLAICRMIIDQHGGELSAASDDGGACFEIVLPTKHNNTAAIKPWT